MKLGTKDMIHCGMFAALTAVGAFISLPIGPVPITLQSFFVLMSGFMLGSKKGMLSQLIYMLMGLIGLPIFAGGAGGLATILKPSFGFIFGFMAMAYISGLLYEKGVNAIISGATATIVLYLIGIPYMGIILNIVGSNNFTLVELMQMGMFMFIPGDTLKVILATLSTSAIKKHIYLPINTKN